MESIEYREQLLTELIARKGQAANPYVFDKNKALGYRHIVQEMWNKRVASFHEDGVFYSIKKPFHHSLPGPIEFNTYYVLLIQGGEGLYMRHSIGTIENYLTITSMPLAQAAKYLLDLYDVPLHTVMKRDIFGGKLSVYHFLKGTEHAYIRFYTLMHPMLAVSLKEMDRLLDQEY